MVFEYSSSASRSSLKQVPVLLVERSVVGSSDGGEKGELSFTEDGSLQTWDIVEIGWSIPGLRPSYLALMIRLIARGEVD
jgi:hypothetical protein